MLGGFQPAQLIQPACLQGLQAFVGQAAVLSNSSMYALLSIVFTL